MCDLWVACKALRYLAEATLSGNLFKCSLVWMIPAENLFSRNLLCYQRLMPNARTSHRMCGLFADSPMLSRKTSGARTKNFSCSTLVNSLQVFIRSTKSISVFKLDYQSFLEDNFRVSIYMLRRRRTDVFKLARLKTMARPTNSFCFLERVNGNNSETISTRSFGFQPALFGGLRNLPSGGCREPSSGSARSSGAPTSASGSSRSA